MFVVILTSQCKPLRRSPIDVGSMGEQSVNRRPWRGLSRFDNFRYLCGITRQSPKQPAEHECRLPQ